jgi:hypothetical protein
MPRRRRCSCVNVDGVRADVCTRVDVCVRAQLRPDRWSLFVGVGIISFNNLLIHTPSIADLSARLVPWWGVSTADHLEHHKRLTTHYAAPTVSIDRLLACVFGEPASYGKEFKDE